MVKKCFVMSLLFYHYEYILVKITVHGNPIHSENLIWVSNSSKEGGA